MADLRTAEYIVDDTLDLLQIRVNQADSPLRKGFTDDSDTTRTSVLRHVNNAIRKLTWTGYSRCYEDISLTAASGNTKNYEYGLNRRVLRVVDVSMYDPDVVSKVYQMGNKDIEIVNINQMVRRFGNWRFATAGRPRALSFVSDILYVYPAPDREWVISLLADIAQPDLLNKVDVPERLPLYFHDDVKYGAALELSHLGYINPAARGRIPYFAQEWGRCTRELTEISNGGRVDNENSEFVMVDGRRDWGLS